MTEHVPEVSPQLVVGVNVPVEFETKLTVPAGTVAVPGETSVTVAVHVVPVFTVTEAGKQTTVVLVARVVTVIATVLLGPLGA